MSALLSAGLQNSIRFETNYLHHSRTLQIINRARFRALGCEGCRAFVTHAVRVGDGYRVSRIGSVAYVIYLMHWLGSYSSMPIPVMPTCTQHFNRVKRRPTVLRRPAVTLWQSPSIISVNEAKS